MATTTPGEPLATKTIYPTGSTGKSPGRATAVVLLHGFSQNGSVLEPFARLIAELSSRAVKLVDLPGHGMSKGQVLSLDETADLIADQFRGDAIVGYSLGGRIALNYAYLHPNEAPALVVIGANPGLMDPKERQARLEADQQLAERLGACGDREQLRAFLAGWLKNPLFGGITADVAGLTQRLENESGPMARMLVATSLGTQRNLWEHAGEISVPSLYLYGEKDEKFSDIARRYCAASAGRVACEAVPSVAHYTIGEAPYATAQRVSAFLDANSLP